MTASEASAGKGRVLPMESVDSAAEDRLQAAIEQSREILTWGDNWDDEGSPGYDEATWNRAVAFLRQCTSAFMAMTVAQRPVPIPRVLPGPDGSIDLDWRHGEREFLLNIPRSLNEPAGYYGETAVGATTKGRLDTTIPNEWILVWLTQ